MSFIKKLYSRNIFLLNLVLLGVLMGFALAFTGFSYNAGPKTVVRAESPKAGSPADDALAGAPPEIKEALDHARGIQEAFRYVASSVLPSIVEISVVESRKQETAPSDQLPFRFFFGEPENDKSPREFQNRGLGSGIIVRRTGDTIYVLTNNHVAGAATKITVILHDGREYQANLVGKDERKDLALVSFKTTDKDIKVANLGDSSSLQVGDWAIAIGSPFGYVSSVTVGVVSALGRTGGPDGNISDFIQTDASINKGNSGGALVNILGEVVGINTWIASPTGTSVGLGFSIPINNAKKAIDDFIAKGQVEYGWLGVSLREIDKASAAELGVEGRKGAFVAHVFKGGPADKSGFLPGDYIVSVDGKEIKDQAALVRAVGDLRAGSTSNFGLVRDGKRLEISAKIEARNPQVASNDSNIFPGADVISLNSEDIDASKLPKGAKGVLVVNVLSKSPAATIGLKPGDIIVEINEGNVNALRDFYRLINDGRSKELVFTVERDGSKVRTLAYVRK